MPSSQSLSNTYSSPPPPIDFSAYKGKISDASVLEKFEASLTVFAPLFAPALPYWILADLSTQAEFKNISYPTYVAEELAEIKAKQQMAVGRGTNCSCEGARAAN